MRIRMNETLATVTATYAKGDTFDFDEGEAKRLIAAGQATAIDGDGLPVASAGVQPIGPIIASNPSNPSPDRVVLDRQTGTPVEGAGTGLTTDALTGAQVGALTGGTTGQGQPLQPSNPGEPEIYGRPLHVWEKMTDEEIDDIPGMGNAKIKNIREAIAQWKSGAPAPTGSDAASEQASQTAPAPTGN
jgi:hypothetical protein